MIRRTEQFYSESWWTLNWKQFTKNLYPLQRRVFKAIKANDFRKAKNLQKLILKSKGGRFLAIRQVTQLNNGKKTAGIDGKTALKFKERFQLETILKTNAIDWKHQGLREVPSSYPEKGWKYSYAKNSNHFRQGLAMFSQICLRASPRSNLSR